MPVPRAIDLEALHRYLWDRSGKDDTIVVNQGKLGEKLGCSHDQVHFALNDLISYEMIEKCPGGRTSNRRYLIKAPSGVTTKHRSMGTSWG